MPDPEIEAMAKCHELFAALEDDSKLRVIQWLISKFQLNIQSSNWHKSQSAAPSINGMAKGIDDSQAEQSIENYDSVADLFSVASPTVDWEKALVVATYLQVKN